MQNQNQQNPQQNELQQNEQQKNKCLFLVSSAIHAKHGVYNTKERLDQTIATCASIKAKVPNADIIILDGGYEHLTDEEKEILRGSMNRFIAYTDDAEVKGIQAVPSHDIVKNAIEILMYGTFFTENAEQIKKEYSRVFKMSGRYTLNDNFDYDFHEKTKHGIVIRGPYTSQFTPDMTGGITKQYMSRLWSFDSSLIPYISECYQRMYAHIITRVNNGGYIDIEHLLFNYLNPAFIRFPDAIGIEGSIAPNGTQVSD
jgi:hypothetical protein